MQWMAWTLPTALFFIGIASLLGAMTVWELLQPTQMRRGWLPMATSRGDRLFIGLLSSAILHLIWLGASDAPVWWVSMACLGLVPAILRWG